MEECGNCIGAPNTGVTNCAETIKKTVGEFMVRTYANDGTPNVIDLTSTSPIDLDAKLNHVDPSKRWYPITDIKGFAIDPSETKYKTHPDDSKEFLHSGIYTAKGVLAFGQPAPLQGQLVKANCGAPWSFFGITIDGSVYGEKIGTNLHPIQMRAFDPKGMFAKDDSNAEIELNFDLDVEFQYGRLRQLSKANFTASPLDAKGLRNANIAYTTAGQTSSVVSITSDYGQANVVQDVHGLVLADFELLNKTTGLAVTITSVTENPNVSYTSGYASQTVGNVLELSLVINTKKFEGKATKVIA